MKETLEELERKSREGKKKMNKEDVLPFCFSVVVLSLMVFSYVAYDAWDFSFTGEWIKGLIGFGSFLILFVFGYLIFKMASDRRKRKKAE